MKHHLQQGAVIQSSSQEEILPGDLGQAQQLVAQAAAAATTLVDFPPQTTQPS